MTLAQGDPALLKTLFEYRCLTSGQLGRRHGRSGQVIRRAIRKRLRPGGFVVPMQRQPAEEAAYTLGPEGFVYMAHELGCSVSELPFSRKASTIRSFFWKHSQLVNDIRISLDLATEGTGSAVGIERTIPEWEMNPRARRKAPHHERFVLSERLRAPDGTTCTHRPDCLLLVYPRVGGPMQRVAVFLEADRATETMRRIRQKYDGYWLYWRRRRFAEAFGALAMRVLFVLDDVQDRHRIHSMQHELKEFATRQDDASAAEAFRRCFRFARKRDLDETTVLARPIWWDADDQARLFFQPVSIPSTKGSSPEAAA